MQLLIFYGIFLAFFLSDRSMYFFWKLGAIFLSTFLLTNEFFKIIQPQGQDRGSVIVKARIAAGVLAFIISESVFAISFMPLNFVNSANLAFLLFFAVSDIIRRYLENNISKRSILANATIFVLVAILIFFASSWSI